MSLRFHTVSDSDISDIEQEPLRLDILYYGELSDPSVLDHLEESEKEKISKWVPKIKSDTFYIEGLFQSLNYLLTLETEWGKGAFPLNFLTGHGLDIGEIGWGKATFYNSNEVKQISEALSNLDYSALEKRYNAGFFNEQGIYPGGYNWTQSDIESLLAKLKEMAIFINETQSKSLGIYRVLV